VQEGEESLSSSLFCFVYAREMRKNQMVGWDSDGQPLKGGILSGFHVSSCHNPIFTPQDFLGCRHAKRGNLDQAVLTRQGPTILEEPQDGARSTFPGVWRGFTNLDQV
jgi:hypothetical protein